MYLVSIQLFLVVSIYFLKQDVWITFNQNQVLISTNVNY